MPGGVPPAPNPSTHPAMTDPGIHGVPGSSFMQPSEHQSVDEQDYNDGTQNDRPIGNLNARYRRFLIKPFHDFSPQSWQQVD